MLLESEQKDQLYTALAQAQHEFPTIRYNRKAFKNEYADLYAILKPVYPVMCKYGLSIRPWAGIINGEQCIGARLMHKSGQFETNVFKFEQDPCKNPNDQPSHKKQGAITYFNRNHIKDILGVLISDNEEDDDGQGHIQPAIEYITKDQKEDIENSLKGYKSIYESLEKFYGSIDNIPRNKYSDLMESIRNKKNNMPK